MASNQNEQNGNGKNAITQSKPQVALTSQGLIPRDMDEAWRYAQALASCAFNPQTYQGKPQDCLIAIDIAMRLRVHPLAYLQNSYVVHGRPGLEAKMVISLINGSGQFQDPLDYEVVGDDPFHQDYRVRAFATRKSTGKILYGPWITWKTVKGEGWESKPGSKWKTMPEMMFHYRAASWFANKHCPEVKMGLDTTDELTDVGPKQVESRIVEDPAISGNEGLKQRLAARQQDDTVTDSDAGAGDEPGGDVVAAGDEPAPSIPEADAEPGLYTCTTCGATFDKTGPKGSCPACKAVSHDVVATADLQGQAAES